ncbi:hypothetical protein BC835DRAFT_1522769 [Cytidiella melzeri]|nr:hypothetical protein BC835DRAFT_1522769 [Cytidiella melzeri]
MDSTAPQDAPVSEATLLLLGPMFAGSLMAFLLFGISIMQLYRYSMANNRDHLAIKLSVYIVFLLDVFQAIVVAAQGWYTMLSGWGRPVALIQLNWTFGAVPAVTGIVAAWVQIFYAWRIYKLSQWNVLPAFIVAVALMQCAAALSITVGIPSLGDVTDLHIMYRRTIVWLGGAFAADVIIAVVMLFLLLSVRRSKFAHTQRIINRLIRLTVETGVVTATCALMELIMFQVIPTTNLHLFFAAMLAKIYYNALMTSLNSRRSGERQTDPEYAGVTSSQLSSTFQIGSNNPLSKASNGKQNHNVFRSFTTSAGSGIASGTTTMGDSTVVHISTEREVDADSYSADLKPTDVFKGDGYNHHDPDVLPMTRIVNAKMDSRNTPTPASGF